MSWEVVGAVSKRQCGGAVRRVLLLTLAQYASHEGRDIFASIPTLARDAEIDERTVQRNIKVFIDEGLLVLVGRRRCRNGHTNEYRIRLSALRELPLIVRPKEEPDEDPRQAATPTPGSVSPLPPAQRHQTPGTVPPYPIKEPIDDDDIASAEIEFEEKCREWAGDVLAPTAGGIDKLYRLLSQTSDAACTEADIERGIKNAAKWLRKHDQKANSLGYFEGAALAARDERMKPVTPSERKSFKRAETSKSDELDRFLARARVNSSRVVV
jgi:hypothetical protein